ncbi:hypothetical protein EUA07_07905 [Nocardioides ganghwensis]|uniref:Uncharacterized protein n=1 Tax=Nocardioides ganghwensis TaxID=252230 RepID=A0A4Q2SGP7_9ACTN|nr:hypothetical protein EUA07_07905 [Nocardioides ganghwensis]
MQTSTHGLTIGATAHAPGLAPRPLRREDGETPVIVMERIPGDPLGPRPLTTVQTEALGASLRRLYGVPVELVREAGVGPRRHGAAEHAQVMREWLAGDHDLGECLDPVLVGEAVDVARAFVASATRRTSSPTASSTSAAACPACTTCGPWRTRSAWTPRPGSAWRPTARCGPRSGW